MDMPILITFSACSTDSNFTSECCKPGPLPGQKKEEEEDEDEEKKMLRLKIIGS